MSSSFSQKGGADDLTLVSGLSVKGIRDQLENRYNRSVIYTYAGDVLVSVNPFERLPIFGEEHLAMYANASLREVPPHVYGIAERAYRRMVARRENQAVIISGESGAGKTECAKLILNYISHASSLIAGSSESESAKFVKEVITQSNPILEAFGNARTVRNDNSSRFGKLMEIYFSAGQPCGGEVSAFLLEKLRVTKQNKGERNFHVFYALLAGADAETREAFALSTPEDYHYLTQGGLTSLDAIDDERNWRELVDAFNALNVTPDVQRSIWRVLAGILHLGNITFADSDSGQPPCVVTDDIALQWASYLFEVDLEVLRQSLTHRMIQTGSRTSSSYFVPQSAQQAAEIRDALAQGMFKRVFDDMLVRINGALGGQRGDTHIGLLDIFGFEIFEDNSLEQLCINYTNEKLQQGFITTVIKGEQEIYQAEGLKWKDIDYHDNAGVCALLDARQASIFATLNDTCRQLHSMEKSEADAKFMSELAKACSSNALLAVPSSLDRFTVKHYAGDVTYSSSGFCAKNVDAMFPSLIAMIKSSANSYVRDTLWRDDEVGKKQPPTTTNMIKSSAGDLLNKKLAVCVPSYIRCIKPNDNRKAKSFNQSRVSHQVEYLGLLENVRVLRSGFAYREGFAEFLDRYGRMYDCGPEKPLPADPRAAITEWISFVGKKHSTRAPKDQFALGNSMVFIHGPEVIYELEDILFEMDNPEEHAERVAAAKEAAALARKQEGNTFGKKKKCVIQ